MVWATHGGSSCGRGPDQCSGGVHGGGARHLFDEKPSHREATPRGVLRVTVSHVLYPVNEEVLHQVFDAYGAEQVVVLERANHVEALVRFRSSRDAEWARDVTHGRCVYDGCCWLDVQYMQLTPSDSVVATPATGSTLGLSHNTDVSMATTTSAGATLMTSTTSAATTTTPLVTGAREAPRDELKELAPKETSEEPKKTVQELCEKILATLNSMIKGGRDVNLDTPSNVVAPAGQYVVSLPTPPATIKLSDIIVSSPVPLVIADSVLDQDSAGHKILKETSDMSMLAPWPPPIQGQLIKELLVENSSNLQKLAVVGNSEMLLVAQGSLGFNLGASYFWCRHSHGRIYIAGQCTGRECLWVVHAMSQFLRTTILVDGLFTSRVKEQHIMWDPGGDTVQFVKFENSRFCVCVDKKMNYATVLLWFIEWARFKSRSTDLVASEMTTLHSFEAFILSKQCKSQCINHGRYCAPDPEPGNDGKDVVENEDNAEHSSPNGTGVQDTSNKFSEDCLFSCDDVPSEIPPKDNGIDNDEIQTEVATWLSKNAPHLDDGLPSQPAFSSDRRQDASTSVLPPEPEDGARFSSDFSVDEINNSNVTYLATNATAGEVFAQPNAIVVCPDDIAVTEVDGMINTIGKDKTSENILVKGSEVDSSCQEKPQTKIEEGHSATTVEEDPSVNNFNVVSKEEIPDEETESKEQIRLILTNSVEQVSIIKEPINLLGNNEPCTKKRVCADGTNGGDLFELVTGGCNLEAPDSVKTQQQTDSTSVAADQLTIPKQTDIEEGQHCPDADEVIIQAVSGIGPAVGAEVMSAGSAATLTKNVCSSEVTTGDGIPEYVSHTSGITFMPSQVDLAELDTYPTSHEIDMVSSKYGVEENRQNVNVSAELTSHVINEVHSIDVEEMRQIEDITACTTSHEANAVCSTGNFGANKQNEEIIAEAGSHKINIVQGTSSVEEKEQIKEVNANPASNKIDVVSSRDIVEEKQQSEIYVETTHNIIVACSIENLEGKRQNEEITADPTHEINAVNIPSNVELKKQNEETTRDPTACEINMATISDNAEEKKQNEEITTDRTYSINVVCRPDSKDKKLNEDITEGPSSHEIIVVHGTNNVEEKNEDTMSDPTSYQIAGSTIAGVEENKQNEEITADPTYRGINVVHTPTSCKIDAESNTDDVEEKRQNEEIVADSSCHENSILHGTGNAEEKKQNEEVVADPAYDKIAAAQSTDDAEEKKQKEETTAKEIYTTQSTDDLKGNDQNEEIADKEVIVDSDKNHVSLKALLAEKGVETKEKKASTKDRVLSFRRRASKDNASPVKPGSPKAGSGHQDWNSPARLPIEKKPKGKKQHWVSFICCPSIN